MPPNPTSPPRKPGRLFDPKSPLRHITMGRKETFRIHPGDIQVRPGFNARTEFTGIEDLAASMFHHGQELPVTVRPTGVEDRPVELINPHFPALRSGHRLFQRSSRQKQIPSNTTNYLTNNEKNLLNSLQMRPPDGGPRLHFTERCHPRRDCHR